MAAENHGILHITEIFYFWTMVFHPKSLELCPKMVLPLYYMVLVAIYIIIPGYYCIQGNKCTLVYRIINKLALFSILLFILIKLYSEHDFLFTSFSSNK